MITKFLSFTNSNNIAIKKAKTLLAVSGGVDSVVLAHICSQQALDFGIAHCNFKLRGTESDEDEEFVKKLAKSLNVEFYVVSFNTTEIAQSQGTSIQMAARDLRYAWFEKIRSKHGYDFIATAHHKGDLVETVLFNLTKTCGIEGLHGIKAQLGQVIRPLLFANRSQIKLFAKKNDIKWRDDSSNELVKYSRNKIRHKVVPILEEINPKAQDGIYNTSIRLADTESFLKFSIANSLKQIVQVEGANTRVNIDLLLQTPGNTYVLNEILKPFNFNYTQVKLIIAALIGVTGKLFYSKSHVLNIDRTDLIISPISKENNALFLAEKEGDFSINDSSISVRIKSGINFKVKMDKSVLSLNLAKLVFPLQIRPWKRGDMFYPLGMQGKKKLSDFMIDAKIPVNLKEKIHVVISDGKIAGILNYRLDRRFKIDEETEHIFEITFN